MPSPIDPVAIGDHHAMKFRPQSPSLRATPPADHQRDSEEQHPSLELRLENAMRVDQYRLKRLRKKLAPDDFQSQLGKSVHLHAARQAARPCIDYSPELPISQHRTQLIELFQQRQVTVVCGETGSGKSTQLPKILLESGLGRQAMIGHTQPRRLAARKYRYPTR